MQKECIIPVRCKNCEITFDVWEDLVSGVEIDESFCRSCRAINVVDWINSKLVDNSFISEEAMGLEG